jgi:putative PIN family toxin of toxin-antitoxin system
MKLVLDTNVLVSAFLWQGIPARLIELASEQGIQLITTRALLAELSEVLQRKKFAKKILATGLTPAQMFRNYQRLARRVVPRKRPQAISRDPDDDLVLACALAAHVDLIVSGDADLLTLKTYQDIPIVTPAAALRFIGVIEH